MSDKLQNNCFTCNKVLNTRNKFCVECRKDYYSKPRKYRVKANLSVCTNCGILKNEENGYKRKNGQWHSYCNICAAKLVSIRSRKFKAACVEYKGGKCEICGYDKNLAALTFHHIDPSKKEFVISSRRSKCSEIDSELEKCQLICANCHAEIHNQHLNINNIHLD